MVSGAAHQGDYLSRAEAGFDKRQKDHVKIAVAGMKRDGKILVEKITKAE